MIKKNLIGLSKSKLNLVSFFITKSDMDIYRLVSYLLLYPSIQFLSMESNLRIKHMVFFMKLHYTKNRKLTRQSGTVFNRSKFVRPLAPFWHGVKPFLNHSRFCFLSLSFHRNFCAFPPTQNSFFHDFPPATWTRNCKGIFEFWILINHYIHAVSSKSLDLVVT